MLATYPLAAIKHVFRFRVTATDRFYSLRSLVSSSSNPACWTPLKVFDKIQSIYLGHFYFYSTKTTQRTELSLLSHRDLSIERICLVTNMADSNCRQGWSHMGENQELYFQ